LHSCTIQFSGDGPTIGTNNSLLNLLFWDQMLLYLAFVVI
jgi:hypothetical protein